MVLQHIVPIEASTCNRRTGEGLRGCGGVERRARKSVRNPASVCVLAGAIARLFARVRFTAWPRALSQVTVTPILWVGGGICNVEGTYRSAIIHGTPAYSKATHALIWIRVLTTIMRTHDLLRTMWRLLPFLLPSSHRYVKCLVCFRRFGHSQVISSHFFGPKADEW